MSRFATASKCGARPRPRPDQRRNRRARRPRPPQRSPPRIVQNTLRDRDRCRSRIIPRDAPSGDLRLCDWQRRKQEDEKGATAWIVSGTDNATMRSHDLADDGETETGTLLLFPRAAPEPFEDVFAIFHWNA